MCNITLAKTAGFCFGVDRAIKLIEKLRGDEEIITLYYGQDVKEEDAVKLQQVIAERYPDCDVDVHYGGQPIYYYYIALE